jgi:hypothetical protein
MNDGSRIKFADGLNDKVYTDYFQVHILNQYVIKNTEIY